MRGAEKMARIPVKIRADGDAGAQTGLDPRAPAGRRRDRAHQGTCCAKQKLHTVCEEAACPNLPECFGGGTATFMIMGDICTRRCPFCDVAHGRPKPLDADEPANLAEGRYVSLESQICGGHQRGPRRFERRRCAAFRRLHQRHPRCQSRKTRIEVLVPDFRGRMDVALAIMKSAPPDVFNHNLENVPRLYREIRPGSDYAYSLQLLKRFKLECPRRADQERHHGGPG
jgi:lipoic acid synthetase